MIIDKIISAQRKRKLTDIEMCCLMGVDRVTWWRIKTQRYEPTLSFMAGVKRVFPQLRDDVNQYLIRRTDTPESQQNGKLGLLGRIRRVMVGR